MSFANASRAAAPRRLQWALCGRRCDPTATALRPPLAPSLVGAAPAGLRNEHPSIAPAAAYHTAPHTALHGAHDAWHAATAPLATCPPLSAGLVGLQVAAQDLQRQMQAGQLTPQQVGAPGRAAACSSPHLPAQVLGQSLAHAACCPASASGPYPTARQGWCGGPSFECRCCW